MKSFSNEIWYGSRDVVPSYSEEFFNSKVIFIDMKNFEEIKSTETFEAIINVVIYQNLIIIQIFERDERMFIYDINSLEIIPDKDFVDKFGIFYNFYNKCLISIPKNRYYETLITYKLENNKLIKHYEIKSNLFKKLRYGNYRRVLGYDKSLLILKDKRIIFCSYEGLEYGTCLILISFNNN